VRVGGERVGGGRVRAGGGDGETKTATDGVDVDVGTEDKEGVTGAVDVVTHKLTSIWSISLATELELELDGFGLPSFRPTPPTNRVARDGGEGISDGIGSFSSPMRMRVELKSCDIEMD